MLDAMIEKDWPELSRLLGGVDLAEHWTHFPEALFWVRHYLQSHPEETLWWTYLLVHQEDARLIGTCGYKGPPSPEGMVEIGYEVADAYQGRGLATEAAAALIDHAVRQAGVSGIVAHTLAEENASVNILRKFGFSMQEEKYDPDDGHIWLWQMTVDGRR